MANLNIPTGLVPKGVPLRENKYQAGGTFYPGDAVKLNSSGLVVVAAAGDELLGAAISKGTSGASCLVADHPDQLFIIQAGAGGVTAQTIVGNMADITATAGSSTYNLSRQSLDDVGGQFGTSSAQMQILGIEERPDNAFGSYVKCIVRINEHAFGDSNAGV